MWINVPWQLCSHPKLCQFIAGLFSFFHDTSQSKHLTSALQLQKKNKGTEVFFQWRNILHFFSFLWERRAKKYVMHEQLETLLSKNGFSLKFKSCMRQKCNRKVSRSSPICNKRPNSWSMRINYFTSNCNSHIKS